MNRRLLLCPAAPKRDRQKLVYSFRIADNPPRASVLQDENSRMG